MSSTVSREWCVITVYVWRIHGARESQKQTEVCECILLSVDLNALTNLKWLISPRTPGSLLIMCSISCAWLHIFFSRFAAGCSRACVSISCLLISISCAWSSHQHKLKPTRPNASLNSFSCGQPEDTRASSAPSFMLIPPIHPPLQLCEHHPAQRGDCSKQAAMVLHYTPPRPRLNLRLSPRWKHFTGETAVAGGDLGCHLLGC